MCFCCNGCGSISCIVVDVDKSSKVNILMSPKKKCYKVSNGYHLEFVP